MKIKIKILLLSFFSLIILSHPLLAIQIISSTAATNDRFSNDPTFIANNMNLSGVGIDNTGKWATLVSENVFLSANHFKPSNGSVITFYATNDPTGSSITRTVASGQRIGDTDIWVGVLSSSVDSNYAFYDIGLTPSLVQNSYMVGRSVNSYTTTQNIAVGRNVLDSTATFTVAGATGTAILATYNETGGVAYESLVQSGDSGAPMFTTDLSNELTIVGTNWFVGTVGTVDTSGFTDLSSDRGAIQTIIAANAVPETTSIAMLSLASLMLITYRKR
ncbi:MAG: hypothetical protein QMC23_09740 [Rubritalea sp.]|jgi:hypothetical protein|tara:strand:+ start:9266 stop:10093 length:828 start_codon:yes stop_codon:yes gene_type:complete